MKHMFNYCAIDWYEDELKANNLDLHQMVRDMDVDGIEQFIYSLPKMGGNGIMK